MHRLNAAKAYCFFGSGIHMLQAKRWNGEDERSLVQDRFEQNFEMKLNL